MRNTNITNSIANVIRFSVRVNEMLCALAAPQHQWRLQPIVGNVSGRNVTGRCYRPAVSAAVTAASGSFPSDIAGSLLPQRTERNTQPGKPGLKFSALPTRLFATSMLPITALFLKSR